MPQFDGGNSTSIVVVGTATEAKQDTQIADMTNGTQKTQVVDSGGAANIGSIADADTALTVIGRLKKLLTLLPAALIAGRFDTNTGAWLGSTAPTVGQKTSANSIPVVLSSDSVEPLETASTVTGNSSVAQGVASVPLVAANAARIGLLIRNDTGAGSLYVRFGTPASLTNTPILIQPQQIYEMPRRYSTARVDGIWDAAGAGSAVIEELT